MSKFTDVRDQAVAKFKANPLVGSLVIAVVVLVILVLLKV